MAVDGGVDAQTGRGTFMGVSGALQSIILRGLGKRVTCAKTVDRS